MVLNTQGLSGPVTFKVKAVAIFNENPLLFKNKVLALCNFNKIYKKQPCKT